jgi:heptosyltransferase-3
MPAGRRAKSLERAARRAVTRALGVVLRPEPEPSFDPARLRRIAVLRLDRRLGNAVILFPMLEALARACPAAEIEVIAPPPYDVAYQGLPGVARIEHFERSSPLSPRGWGRVGALRGRRYDLVVEAGHHHSFSLSGALLARVLGAPLRLGFRRGESPRFLNLLVDPPAFAAFPPGPGRARIFFELARRLDPRAVYSEPRWAVTADERDGAARERGRLDLGPRTLGVHPGGRGARRWPREHFEAVIRAMEPLGFQPVVFLGEAERDQADAWRRAAGPAWRIVEAPALRRFAALLETLSLWVSADTGPLHVAVATGVPSVGVLLHPEGLQALEETARYRRVYREGGAPTVEEVVAALRAHLEADGGHESEGRWTW